MPQRANLQQKFDLIQEYWSLKIFGLFIMMGVTPLAQATPQVPDILYYNGDTLELYGSPLDSEYPELERLVLERVPGISSDCWRGYVAEWGIENDSLFLLGAVDCLRGESINDLIGQICGPFINNRIFARWVIGHHFCAPEAPGLFFSSSEIKFRFNNGILSEVIEFNQLHPESELMSERQIADTVFSHLNMDLLFPNDSFTPQICRGVIQLDSLGNMVEVEISEEYNQPFGRQVKAILETKKHWVVGYFLGEIVVYDFEFLVVFREEDYNSIMER